MIEIKELNKSFDDIKAVDNVSFDIKEAEVFGLIGTNGAGKSTILRILSGVYKQESGIALIDGNEIYDNPEVKKNVFFISDEPYFWPNSTAQTMGEYYAGLYDSFDMDAYGKYIEAFRLDKDRKINTYSKGMKKQLAMLLGICSKTKYLLCDETFDGLDTVMRQAIKSMLAKEIEDRKLTPVIASHNLRELEDICDHIGLLHQGGILLSKDLEDMKLNIQKVQCVFKDEADKEKALNGVEIANENKRGQLYTFTLRTTREEAMARFSSVDTIFYEVLPLTLEEIFISETEVAGYDIKKILLG
ncbi:MAG: ABC transporter ATP-binding protein [Lachnospiraceae bacterium]|nr:ABC transporter ATP-binding protein [Lachnospiraceae bacterium]